MSVTKQKIRRILLVLFLTNLFIILTVSIILLTIGPDLLIKKNNPKPSDAIVVLSGNQERLEHASDLYNKGLADHIILSNSTESGTTMEEAISLGIPKKSLLGERGATSTYENSLFTKEIMKENNFNSAIIVTSNYHALRSKFTFDKVYNDDIQLSYSFAPSFYNPDNGITKRESETAFKEYAKLSGYWFRSLFQW
ncbi:YdcF family protein [Halobacillus seohaensis]|uniref:YdcF family protein n=1 Tax=Halobacillus seohaensis TaxID=447421 RepID=A0ABW2ELD2_9BACI